MGDFNYLYFSLGGIFVCSLGLIFLMFQLFAYINPRRWFGKKAYLKRMRELKRMNDEIMKEHLYELDDEN